MIFDRNHRLSRNQYEIGPWLLWITNRKKQIKWKRNRRCTEHKICSLRTQFELSARGRNTEFPIVFLISGHREHVSFGAAMFGKLGSTVALLVTVPAEAGAGRVGSRLMSADIADSGQDSTLNWRRLTSLLLLDVLHQIRNWTRRTARNIQNRRIVRWAHFSSPKRIFGTALFCTRTALYYTLRLNKKNLCLMLFAKSIKITTACPNHTVCQCWRVFRYTGQKKKKKKKKKKSLRLLQLTAE